MIGWAVYSPPIHSSRQIWPEPTTSVWGIIAMARDAFLVSATHTEKEIDDTLAAFERTLGDIREEGLL